MGGVEHEEAAQLHDKLEPPGTSHGVPANLLIAILEMPSGGAPNQHGHHFTVLQYELAQAVTRLPARAKQVLLVEHAMGNFPVGWALRSAYL